MNIKDRSKFLIQRIANSLGYEIHRLPPPQPLIPPPNIMNLVGSTDSENHEAVGEAIVIQSKELCGLKPNENILDVGCGCGRFAVPLSKYLNRSGTYEGFDVVPELIEWCVNNISSKFPNFHFQLANIFNQYYNPKGQFKPSEYRFPYQDESFDLVVLTSVFTHILPQDMENYLSEISRVLRKGKSCLITYFLLNDQSLSFINAKLSTLNFNYVFDKYRTISEATPEEAVAYPEEYIRGLYKTFDLEISIPIKYGAWCGRKEYLGYQDIIVAKKI